MGEAQEIGKFPNQPEPISAESVAAAEQTGPAGFQTPWASFGREHRHHYRN